MKPVTLMLIPALLIACAGEQPIQETFLTTYNEYCGNAYEGKTTIADIGGGEAFANARLLMILESCDDEMVRIPFYVDDDRSRTWIVQLKKEGLHLSHDHRYEDGTEHANNFYGGYADERGSALKQYFPADERTIQDRPTRAINTWSKAFDPAGQSYYYRLYLNNELRFEAAFDLANPVSTE